jgi:hypothetical protein
VAITDIRQTALQIINRVLRKFGVDAVTTLTQTKQATAYLDLLNEVLTELSDFGEWLELAEEINVTAQSSVADYSVQTSALIHHISEIAFDTDPSPLTVVEIDEMRQFGRLNRFGRPRQVAIFGVDVSGNPKYRVDPVPSATQAGLLFKILLYQKPRLLTTSDASVVIPFPSDVVFQGLYAKALLEENGGEPNNQYQWAYREYERMKKEASNRWTGDTGNEVRFYPGSR